MSDQLSWLLTDWMVQMTDRKNMSIMELANQILSEHDRAMTFNELFDMICQEKAISAEEKAEIISQVYTDFISSAKFIYVGDDEWDIKGRRAIELWDKDGAYYDEYPDYEEELNIFEGEKAQDEYSIDPVVPEEEEEEEESIYEKDIDEDDIEDAEDSEYDDFEEDEEEYIEDEADLDVEKEKEEVIFEEEDEEEFDDEEYNEYMDDYEEMYED